jgi:carboxypeptidase PM20D1
MDFSIFIIIAALLLFIIAFMLIRTARVMKPIPQVEKIDLAAVDAEQTARHLSEAIQIQTISSDRSDIVLEPFQKLHNLLEKSFPLLHQHLKKEIISEATLLFTWQGKKPELKPVLFAAHQDVVPADEQTLAAWTYAPFSGEIADGYVWGRGALDIKSQMIALLEAAEKLLAEGYIPERTIYFGFGQDEEIGGKKGAAKIVEYLQSQGIRLSVMMDEGGSIMSQTLPGVNGTTALIGIAEKGHLSLRLHSEATPGHSSMPGKDMAIGRLSKALSRLADQQQPARMTALKDLYANLGSAASFGMQFIFANLWFFGPIARKQIEENPQTNASIRTTTALTMINAGVKDNVLPHTAEAIVNMRLLPGDSIARVCERVRKIIHDDQVAFEPVQDGYWEASPVSPTDSSPYQLLALTIGRVFEDTAVAPYLVMGATDARYYAAVSDAVYRFCPFVLQKEDLHRMHGIDERLSVDGLAKMVQFFHQLIWVWGKAEF